MTRHDAIQHLQANHQTLRDLGVASLSLFGSVVRDEATETSDIDLLVSFSKPVGYFEFLDVKAFLETLLGVSVDLATQDMLRADMLEPVLSESVEIL